MGSTGQPLSVRLTGLVKYGPFLTAMAKESVKAEVGMASGSEAGREGGPGQMDGATNPCSLLKYTRPEPLPFAPEHQETISGQMSAEHAARSFNLHHLSSANE